MEQKKILVVEDEKDCQLVIAAELRKSGFKVVSAGDAAMAVQMAVQEKPDLILLDIGLPAGSGLVVMDRITSISTIAMTPIIIVTASHSVETQMEAFKKGAVAYFQKPFDFDELLMAVQRALGVSRTSETVSKQLY